MLRSLYAGVSGMRSFQTKMDVIANNIANVNTTAFKSGRARFQDMLSQTVASAQSPSEKGLGGVNAKQIGLGVKVGTIDTIMTGGPLQPTNRELDFAIEGEGFFAVSQDSDAKIKSYTRDGAFYSDHAGNLANADGLRVLGYVPTTAGTYKEITEVSNLDVPKATDTANEKLSKLQALKIPKTIKVGGNDLELQDYSIDSTGKIVGVYSDGKGYVLGQVGVVNFTNPEGLVKSGNNNYANSNNSGEPVVGTAGTAGYGTVRQGFVEMSNVDLATEFTEMIITSRAYSANSRTISTSDEMLQELINLKR